MLAPVAQPSVILLALAAGMVTARCELVADLPSELLQTQRVGQLFDAPNASAPNVPSLAEFWEHLRDDECKIFVAVAWDDYETDQVSQSVLDVEWRLEQLKRVVDGAPVTRIMLCDIPTSQSFRSH